jgi:acetyltransferase-like isoleucine patch superfamily enzyme
VKPVTIPWTDVNSESAIVVAWHVADRAPVTSGSTLLDVETSKAALEIEAETDGFLLQMVEAGETIGLDEPVAYLFDDEAALLAFVEKRAHETAASSAADSGDEVRATAKARARAEELGVDLQSLPSSGLITVRHVEEAAGAVAQGPGPSLEPLHGDVTTERLLLIGAGLGATQVVDILAGSPGQSAIAIVDDDASRWGERIRGVPVVGGSSEIAALWERSAFDAAVITISTSVTARARLRALCQTAGIPLANVIDATAKVATGVRMGAGNVICAFVQLGTETRIGDNNFISAFNSFDHHNVLGSDISTGPGCMTSGEVHLEDRVRLGTGIVVEPKLTLGTGVVVASGSVIVRSVPPHHAVKTKIVTTTVVPVRDEAPHR